MRDDDPKRLRALAPPDSRLARGLVAARDRGPSDAELRALGAAVFGASAGGLAATKAGASGFRLFGLTKAVTALAVAGTVAATAGVAWHLQHRTTGHESTTPALAPSAAPQAEPQIAAPALAPPTADHPSFHVERRHALATPAPSRRQAAASAVAGPASPVAPVPAEADEELRLVGAAQRALPRDPATALALAREHARRFPDGVLAQERDAVTISALWQTGHRDEARARARRFIEQHPASTYAGRIREILGQSEAPAP